jgi:hypothetical protein
MRISVHVQPGARRPGVGGRHGSVLKVRVAERAVEGGATDATLAALAHAFGLARRDVRLVAGARAREKVVELDGEAQSLADTLERLLEGPTAAA